MESYYIKTDGASRGNPGLSGYGGVIEDEDGKILLEVKGFLGEATNNEAEYQGISFTLAALASLLGGTASEDFDGFDVSVICFSDSQLAVRQLNGQYKVSEKFQDVHRTILEMKEKVFKDVTFNHIPRTENSLADRLANDAIDDHLRTIGSE